MRRVKGVAPDITGVAGAVVKVDGLKLVFGGARRVSPYDLLLDELVTATAAAVEEKLERPALKFGNVKARTSVAYRAKKKGLRMEFAEQGGALYVRIVGQVGDELKASRRAEIEVCLKAAPGGLMPLAITKSLRLRGDATVDAPVVEAILAQVIRDGSVIRAEGGVWKVNPRRPAVA